MISPYQIIVITADEGSAELISQRFANDAKIKAKAITERKLHDSLDALSQSDCHALVLTDALSGEWESAREILTGGRNVPVLTIPELKANDSTLGIDVVTLLESRFAELAERLNLAKSLQQREADIIRVIQKSADSIFVFDDDGRILFMNPAARAFFSGNLDTGAEFGYPLVDGETTEIDIVGIHGKRSVADMRVTSIEWNNRPCCLAILHDVTERKIAEETLEQMVQERTKELEAANAQLTQMYRISERAVQLRSQFIANVSHEIRTPLGGIVSGAELLCGVVESEESKELASVIFSSGKRLLDLVNEILDFAKIERGEMRLNETDFSVQELVNELLAQMQPMAEQKELRLLSNLSPKLEKRYLGDCGKIRQILLNLVHNSLKFTHDGGVMVTVLPGENLELVFIVRDTGIGIETRDLPLIFQPFVQGKSGTKEGGGTGLGLSICSQLAKCLNGSISCQSGTGDGSTFTLRIPLRRP